jgi:hypothetical protein
MSLRTALAAALLAIAAPALAAAENTNCMPRVFSADVLKLQDQVTSRPRLWQATFRQGDSLDGYPNAAG